MTESGPRGDQSELGDHNKNKSKKKQHRRLLNKYSVGAVALAASISPFLLKGHDAPQSKEVISSNTINELIDQTQGTLSQQVSQLYKENPQSVSDQQKNGFSLRISSRPANNGDSTEFAFSVVTKRDTNGVYDLQHIQRINLNLTGFSNGEELEGGPLYHAESNNQEGMIKIIYGDGTTSLLLKNKPSASFLAGFTKEMKQLNEIVDAAKDKRPQSIVDLQRKL